MYIGIDVHKRYAQVAVRNDAGDVVDEVRVKNANLDEFAQQYAGAKAVLEATSNYYHIQDTLSKYLDVIVAHPGKLALIAKSDTKTDRVDAKELSRLLRLDSVPESYVPADEIRECRALVRGRESLVQTRTEYANKIHGLLADVGITKHVKPLSVAGREFLEELSLEAPWDTLLSSYLGVIDELNEQEETLVDHIEERAKSLKETQIMESAPGISHITALTVLAEIGNVGRFEGHKEVVSYVGMNPTIRESGDSRYEGTISKTGSGRVRWLLVQAAYNAVDNCEDEYLKQFHDRLAAKKPRKKAIVATARKLLVSLYYMLDREEMYNPPGVSS